MKAGRAAALAACAIVSIPLIAAAGSSVAVAEDGDWTYDADNNKAVAIQEDSLLAVLCGEDNDLVVYYSVPEAALEKPLVSRKEPYLAIATDGDLSGLSGYSVKAFPQDIDGVRYFTFRGKAALSTAKAIGKAKHPLFITVSTKNPATAGKNYPKYNSHVYPPDGADDAIAELFENCPQD
jgi:hypothetical protein